MKSVLHDKKHTDLVKLILLTLIKCLNFKVNCVKTEYPFNHYGDRGFIDVIAWRHDKKKSNLNKTIYIFEAKPILLDIGKTLRQIHSYDKYISSHIDYLFGSNFGKKRVVSILALNNNVDNWKIVNKYQPVFAVSNIKIIAFYSQSIPLYPGYNPKYLLIKQLQNNKLWN